MFWGRKKRGASARNPFPYKVFTERFDREVSAKTLYGEVSTFPPPGTASLESLGEAIRAQTPSSLKATQRSMAFQSRYSAGHDLGERPVFTLLIDHSGSMRGPKALAAAVAADTASAILEFQRVPLDVLGFTTRSWKGGSSRMLWIAMGRPAKPGRLCDLLHIVYRDGASPTPSWSHYLPLMLLPVILRENIDGEALLWARKRAMAHNPTSWVCILVSDGAPVDDSTIQANGEGASSWYLSQHLRSVITEFNADPCIRLGCLALHHETDMPFRSVQLTSILDQSAIQIFDLLEDLIWPAAKAE